MIRKFGTLAIVVIVSLMFVGAALAAVNVSVPPGTGLGGISINGGAPILAEANGCVSLSSGQPATLEVRSHVGGFAMSGRQSDSSDWEVAMGPTGSLVITGYQGWLGCFSDQSGSHARQLLIALDPNAAGNVTRTLLTSSFSGPEVSAVFPHTATAGSPVTVTFNVTSTEVYSVSWIVTGPAFRSSCGAGCETIKWASDGTYLVIVSVTDEWGSLDVVSAIVEVLPAPVVPVTVPLGIGMGSYALDGGTPYIVTSSGCASQMGESADVEIRTHRGGYAMSGRPNSTLDWQVQLGYTGTLQQVYEPALICFSEDGPWAARQLLLSADPNAANNFVLTATLSSFGGPSVSLTGTQVITAGVDALYTHVYTSSEVVLTKELTATGVYTQASSGPTHTTLRWANSGAYTVTYKVTDIWGSYDQRNLSVTVKPAAQTRWLVFLALVMRPAASCSFSNVPVDALGAFNRGPAWTVAATPGCFQLSGTAPITIQSRKYFATNGYDNGWVTANGANGEFSKASWQGSLICFGNTRDQALSLLATADPNSTSNPQVTWASSCQAP